MGNHFTAPMDDQHPSVLLRARTAADWIEMVGGRDRNMRSLAGISSVAVVARVFMDERAKFIVVNVVTGVGSG